jgi:hypothetical protein
MPVDLVFRSDSEFMPLQGADMLAWLFRNALDNQEDGERWRWLFCELTNVVVSDQSCFIGEVFIKEIVEEKDAKRFTLPKLLPRRTTAS